MRSRRTNLGDDGDCKHEIIYVRSSSTRNVASFRHLQSCADVR
jgi:hypothetical protein